MSEKEKMAEKKPKEKKRSALNILMQYAGSRKYLTYISIILSGASAVLGLFPFICIFNIIRDVIDIAPDFAAPGVADGLIGQGIIAVVFAFASMIVYFIALMCSHVSAFRIATNIRKTLISHIAKLPAGVTDEIGSGRLRRVANDSAAAAETYLAHNLPDTANVFVTPAAMVIILFIFDWRFGLVSLIPVALSMVVMSRMMGTAMAEDMKKYKNALEAMNNEAVEYIRGMSVVKTFSQTVHSFSRFKNSIDNYYKFCISYTKQCRAPMVYFQIAVNSTFAFLIALALILCRGDAAISDVTLNFIFYVIFTPMIATAFTKIMYMGESAMSVNDALKRFDSLLSIEPLKEPEDPKKPADNSVEFNDVTFSYKKSAAPAVDHVSMKINAGSTVALVGPSGSGKSTVASLAARFRDPDSGRILIGGVDVRDVSKETLVDTVSYVFQDSRLLKMSIADNVRLARPEATDDQVRKALSDAQCDDIISKMPDGIHTVIGTKGIYLSGGEQQRIAIARAILKDSPVLVLDEATAFADPENEVLVHRAFERLAHGKTVIMIAHRLTTIKNADCIYVMDHGRIVESGRHDELVAAGGLYSKMWSDYQSSASWKVGVER